MTRVFRFTVFLLVLAGVVAIRPVFADGSLFGTLSGKVKDESGGALPGGLITVRSLEKGFERTATTASAGTFNIALLPPGRYRTTASISGFETYISDGDVIQAERTTDGAISLKHAHAP